MPQSFFTASYFRTYLLRASLRSTLPVHYVPHSCASISHDREGSEIGPQRIVKPLSYVKRSQRDCTGDLTPCMSTELQGSC